MSFWEERDWCLTWYTLAGLLALEALIREAVVFAVPHAAWQAGDRLVIAYLDTVTDEDRLPHYKTMASRFEVKG